ncbi:MULTISPECIES: YqaJ viral recombinase family protein [Acinetobacter]|uniref:YqaJ viral recombinase family nuclease n=1 Tax=Acinetobacter TaxID=469 RepID=UPI0007108E72|nr:YqaJ viral recombinase family protein [Acinetobacter pittii]KRJ19313.1 YqaJ-like viral recombinase [Acinetobacter pittii]MCU4344130.1 YqaJ viral recombinase family protein [Acinetobacter pittii]MCU4354695.1 YqaJ viral recombinase family protein [Acinetobacter pittii]
MNQIINPTVTSQSQYLPTVANDKLKQSQSGSKRSLNAKRLINTKQLDYQAWLEVRKQGIGSSDAAAACGLNPYMSMLELWMIKTGRVQQNIDDESSGHAPLYWGKQLEPLVAEYYSLHTNNKVRRVNAVLQHPDPDKAFMLANLDYAVVGNEDVQILECKTAGEYGAKLWRDGVPLYVLCQVQHQLAVTGKQAAHVCVLICGHETKIFKVTRSESVIEHIVQAERYFWECVEKDTPPSVDASESAAKAIQQLYPAHVPLTVEDLSQNENANLMFDQLIKMKEEIQNQQERFDQLKHEIQMMMQDKERAVFVNGSVVWKKAKDSISLNTKALLQHQPELIELYPLEKQGSRRFNIYTD